MIDERAAGQLKPGGTIIEELGKYGD